MLLELGNLNVEERQQLRRQLNEELRDQIVAGATSLEVVSAPPAHDELFRLVLRSNVDGPSVICVMRGAGPGPESAA